MENYQEYNEIEPEIDEEDEDFANEPDEDDNEEDARELSNRELREFLAEIEVDDDDINEAERQYEQQTSLDAEIDALTQEKYNPRNKEHAARKYAINQSAFTQSKIPLTTPITKDQLKRLVYLLTEKQRQVMENHEAFINRRLTRLLSPFIPYRIKRCKLFHPEVIRMSKGFMYQASKEFGQGKTFWATPNIPAYFKQGEELELLRRERPEFLFQVDKTIAWYNRVKTELGQRELAIATRLMTLNEGSWYSLLKLNPHWFEMLFNDVTQSKLCE